MIELHDVSKTFRLYSHPSHRVLEWVGFGPYHQQFHALRNINLQIPKGRTVGIIGANGAGKSTLLKLITGVLLPTSGHIQIKGRIAALLELGTGFHPEFTGRQNIYINGQFLGMSKQAMEELEPEIIAFSELGAFIDQPIRTYSSGMYVRLGFSIAACVNPEILIVDEALSVGDARFSQKCIRRIREYRDKGTTILFVSHDPGAISLLCDEAVLLDKGEMRSIGTPKDILEEYTALLAAQGSGNQEMLIARSAKASTPDSVRRHGTFQALISDLELTDEEGIVSDVFHPGALMVMRMQVSFLTEVQNPSIGFMLRDRLGQDLYGTNTALQEILIGDFKSGDSLKLEVRLPLRLGYGDYSITVAIHDDETHLEKCFEWTDNAAIFRVRHREKPTWAGIFQMDPKITFEKTERDHDYLMSELAIRFPELPTSLGAELAPPSPFLTGFQGVKTDADGIRYRSMASLARMVIRAGGEQLELKVRKAAGATDEPITVHCSLIQFGPLCRLEHFNGGVINLTLPSESQSGHFILEIRTEGAEDGTLEFLSIESIPDKGTE